MPQFDLANATLSSAGLQKIKDAEGFIPFVYDDGYPLISVLGVDYSDNDSKPPSASTNYIQEFYGRLPYEPNFHTKIRGTLTIGYGCTLDGKPLKDNLYHQVYTDGIEINGTTYTFPAEFTEAHATNSTGGYYKDSGGTQQTGKAIRIKYIGDDSTNSNMVFSESLASDLLEDKLASCVTKVKTVFSGYEDSFPYDNTLAQQHFDMMVSLCFHQGKDSFEYSYFVSLYKDVDGTSVTAVADLTAYNNPAYALMWLASVGYNGTYYWVQPQIDRRNNDIDELVGTDASRTFPTGLNPLTQPDWYQGVTISTNYFSDIKNTDFGLDGSLGSYNSSKRTIVSEETLDAITPSVDFHTGALSALKQVDTSIDFADIYTGNRSIYDSEPGSSTFYANDPLYQKYYSKYWQPNEKFYHGNQVFDSPRAATKHGPVFAANPDGQTPAFILGLNEDGSGTSKVYMRSTLGQSSISAGTDSGIWDIANGKSLGTIDYGQWNHFAITRKGNVFRTFKNGTKVTEWTSNKSLTRNTRDGTLKFSIGRSQGSDYFYGYIDDFRITKGTALYTEDFTSPSSALSTTSTTGLYNGDHYVESVYAAINKVSEQLGTEYRINTTGTLDAGLKEVLFQGHGSSEPPAIIVRDVSGEDPAIVGLIPESITAAFDAEDYVSGVELLTQAEGSSQSADHAEAFDENTPYRDLFGAPLERVQFVGENDIPNIQRQSRAQSYLNELKKIKKTLSLSLEQYEIQGDFNIGDMIYVYDPEIKFEDTEAKRIEDGRSSLYEVAYRGQIINPEKIRITGITWPVKDGYGVYLRKVRSTSPYRVEYIDLTDYISWETGNTQLDIGDLQKRLGEDLRFSSAVTGVVSGTRQYAPLRPKHPDTGVEGDLKLTSGTIQDAQGQDKAIIFVQWQEPTYDNGTPIQNGLQYQIQWKPTNSTGEYQSSFVNWNTDNDFTIEGVQLATDYTVRVTAILTNANSSDPATGTITTAIDTAAPSKPGPASTIAAGALRVQIIHNLGRAEDDDGNPISSIVDYTLQKDTHHLNVYASTTSGYSLATSNDKEQYLVGELPVGASSIRHQIPVVGEVQVANGDTHYWRFTAVDNAGNESDPSDEQSANGNLVATANISDAAITTAKIQNLAVTDAKIDTLTAGKITAGTIAGQEIIVGTNTSDSAIIKSSNYLSGSAGWKIDADGTAEFESGAFRGDITGASGTFSGSLSAGISISAPVITGGSITGTSGTFTGDISGASGTFTGDLSGANISGGTIDIGGSDNTSFHVDADGNMWLGAGSYASAPFKVSNAGDLTATSVTASDVFVTGVAITPSTTTSAINMNSASSATSTFTMGTNGVVRTSSSYPRVELAQSGSDSFAEFFNSSGSPQLQVGLNAGTNSYIVSNSNPLTIFATGTTDSQSTMNLNANVINLTKGSSVGRPKLLIDGGTGTTTLNKSLGIDVNGNIAFGTVASGYTDWEIFTSDTYRAAVTNGERVTWNAGSGLNVGFSATNQVITYSADFGGSAGQISEGNHTHSYDNYGSWTAKAGGNNMTVSSGFGVEWKAGTGISLSVNTSPYEITINNTATGSSGVTSVSGSNSSSSDGRFMRSTALAVGGTTLYYYTSTRGDDLTIQGQRPTSNNTSSVGLSATQYNEVHARYGYFDFITGANVSSQDVKTDITDLDLGLNFINALAPKKYKYKPELKEDDGKYGFGFIAEEIETLLLNEGESNSKLHQDGHTDYPNYGRCAHELVCTCEDLECCPEPVLTYNRETEEWTEIEGCDRDAKCTMACCTDIAGTTIDGINYVHATEEECETEFIDGRKYASVMKEELIAPLVKAVQELSTQISDLTARIEALEG